MKKPTGLIFLVGLISHGVHRCMPPLLHRGGAIIMAYLSLSVYSCIVIPCVLFDLCFSTAYWLETLVSRVETKVSYIPHI